MNEPDANAARESLFSEVCSACEGIKPMKRSFCRRCYYRLPVPMRKALYKAEGYADTWRAALQKLLPA